VSVPANSHFVQHKVSSYTQNEGKQLYEDKNSKLKHQDGIGGFEELVL